MSILWALNRRGRQIAGAKWLVSLPALLASIMFVFPALARVPVATPLELRGDGGDPRAIEPSAIGSDLYFAADLGDGAGREPVRYRSSDGSIVRLGDVNNGVGDADPYNFVAVTGGVLFRAHPSGSAGDGRLYRYDGSAVSEVFVQGGGSAINPSALTLAADGAGTIVYLLATISGEQRVMRYDAGSNVVVPIAGLDAATCARPRSLIALNTADSAALLCDHPHSDGPTRPTLVFLDGAAATFVEELERSSDDTLVRPNWTDRLVASSNPGTLVAGVADFGRGEERVLISLSGGTYYAALGASADTVAFITGVEGYGGADILANLAFSAVQLALAPAVNGNDLVVSALSLANGSAFEAVHAGSELAISYAPASARQNREPVVYQGGALSAPIVTDLVAGTSDGSDPADFSRGDSFFLFSADEGAGVRRVGYIDLDDESAGYLTPAAGVGAQPISFRTFANGRVAFSALNGANRTIYVTDVAAVCGDGLVEGSETCDDGAANGTPNNCNASCDGTTASVCGNSVVEAGEDCDTGGQSATCEADCSTPQCGDGVVNNAAGETCDDGVDNGTPNKCNASCDGTTASVCGNSVVEAGEDCDTGGQSATCEADCSTPQCGDGVVNNAAGETCDDGAANGTPNNCNASCDGTTASVCGNSVVEAGEDCDTGGQSATCEADCSLPQCGDGVVNNAAGETCDDGANNGTPLNCNASCDGTTEPVCGNSVVEAGETCDDGANNGTPLNCNASCDGTTPPVCGNSVVEAGEDCDTGGQSATCEADCSIPQCGDGVVNNAAGETCDDGANNGTPLNCNASCDGTTASVCGNSVVEAGEDCDTGGQSATCEADCSNPQCGDGVVNNAAGETCDDGANNGTPLNCNVSCDGTTPPVCGNSVVEAGETCDDGADNGTPNNCNASCDGTTEPVCGNSVVEAGEDCDTGGQSATCEADCSNPQCGDGVVNNAAGETCDDGANNGTPLNCNASCDGTTASVCGNSVVEAGEDCDTGGQSATCEADCSNPQCGDGVVNNAAGETCDDGADNGTPNNCNASCDGTTEPVCGNSVVEAGETCDDGADNGTPNNCNATCDDTTAPVCGNDVIESGETCDDGADNGTPNNCNATCDDTTTPVCGNDVIESGETCDDGADNGTANNCNESCDGITGSVCGNSVVEAGEDCDTGGQSATCEADCSDPACGDGVVNNAAGETCDDGSDNGTPNNCNTTCDGTTASVCGNDVIESGETCDDGSDNGTPNNCNASCDGTTEPVCGNDVIEAGETCDDGSDNGTPNNCNASCDGTTEPVCGNDVIEAGETCDDGSDNGTPNNCNTTCDGTTEPVCGNGVQEEGEACDDANDSNDDDCTNACLLPGCGDGITQAEEACDDGNVLDADGCSMLCEIEEGWDCTPLEDVPDTACEPIDGDGIVVGDEACDDGNTDAGDGCSEGEVEEGWNCDNASPSSCSLDEFCGDGIVQAGESCDDGNDEPGDGCDASCAIESGYMCDDASPTTCLPDGDNDGVADGDDNCPEDANADQSDEDADGIGDACDEPTEPGEPGEEQVNFSGGRGFGSCATSSAPTWPFAALLALALVAIRRRRT